MKIEINVTAKEFEMTNFLLSQAIESLKNNQRVRDHLKVTDKQLILVEKFRKKMVKQFLKALK